MTSDDKIAAFLAERRNLVVVGIRADGRPHATPNWFSWDGTRFYVSTTRDRLKFRIFTRDPRAQLLIDDPRAQAAGWPPERGRSLIRPAYAGAACWTA